MIKRILALIACAAVLVGLAACGGGYADNLVSADNAIAFISGEDVNAIEGNTAYGDIIEHLGPTQNTGGEGQSVATYLVDGTHFLHLPYTKLTDKCPHSGEELMGMLVEALGIRGVVTEAVMSNGELTVRVEAADGESGMFDVAIVRIGADTVVVTPDEKVTAMERIGKGDTVDVVFAGAVAESYPVQGRALRVVLLEETGA